MGIVNDDVARVRQEADIVAVIGDHVALKRVGRRYQGLCPFHAEKSPSFSVSPENQLYYCFGCHKGGDVIDFVREHEGLAFADAVERLAVRFGVPIRYDDASHSQERQRRDRLVAVNAAAVAFYHRLLLAEPAARTARDHLRVRGFTGDAARRFQLGYAPDGWDRLSHHLQQERFSRDDIVAAGLAFVNKANKLQDQFRHRLMFPIFDTKGDPVGFGGRTLTGDGPKYRNTQETALYRKSQVLYGLNWARAEIVAKGEVVVCEGYTDVMAYHLAGIPRAVATCGTALADEHFTMLKNLARTIVIAYDADAAGQAAAERFYRWEQQFEVRLKVAALPAGRDPAEVWLGDADALAASIDQARPFLEFRVQRVLDGADLTTAEGRAAAANAAVGVIGEHPDDLVRDQYLMRVAERTGIDVERLRGAVDRARRGARPLPVPVPGAGPRGRPARPVDQVELEALRAAVHFPALVADRLDPVLFADPSCVELLDALLSTSTLPEALDALSPEVRPLLERIAVEEPHLDLETAPEPAAVARGSSGGRFDDARAVLVRHLRTSVEHEHAQERYVILSIAGLVEAAARRFVSAVPAAADPSWTQLRAGLDALVRARSDSDWAGANRVSEGLVDLLRALEVRSADPGATS
jgi:DNA primase